MVVSSPGRFNVASLYLPLVQARPVAWEPCGCSGDLGMPLGQATDSAVWVHNSQCHCEAASLVFQNLTLSTLALDPETSRRSRQAGRFLRERPWSGLGGTNCCTKLWPSSGYASSKMPSIQDEGLLSAGMLYTAARLHWCELQSASFFVTNQWPPPQRGSQSDLKHR